MNGQNGRKKLRIRYRLSVVFFGAVLIFGFVFYRYMKTVSLEDVLSQDRQITFFNHNPGSDSDDDTAGDSEQPVNADAAGVVNPVPESEKADESYLSECVFVGDSITYGLCSYEIVPKSNVLASAAMSVMKIDTEQLDTSMGSMTVLEALTELNPKNIYIMLGSNGAAYATSDSIYQNYQAFLNKVKMACPESDIYVISTPPVTSAKENSTEAPIKNADIDDLNAKLLDYCNSNGVMYLDLNSELKGTDGFLPSDYAENDGMHFKLSTYSIFTDYILTHVRG